MSDFNSSGWVKIYPTMYKKLKKGGTVFNSINSKELRGCQLEVASIAGQSTRRTDRTTVRAKIKSTHTHARRGHQDPRKGDSRDSLDSSSFAVANFSAVLGLQLDAVLQLGHPHERYIDAIGCGHRCQRDQSAYQGWRVTEKSIQAEGGHHRAAGRHCVALQKRVHRYRAGTAAVRVIHYRVERLVNPLPRDHVSRCPEEL